MSSVKPSRELIDKTILLAHQEQVSLQRAKVQKSTKTLYNLNFKKYTALACTLIFAIFAVKLWSDQSKEQIPSKPAETTTDVPYTSVAEVGTLPTETPYESYLEGDFTSNVSNFDYGTNSVGEYTTCTDGQFVSIITPSVSDDSYAYSVGTTTSIPTDTSVSVTTVPNMEQSEAAIGSETADNPQEAYPSHSSTASSSKDNSPATESTSKATSTTANTTNSEATTSVTHESSSTEASSSTAVVQVTIPTVETTQPPMESDVEVSAEAVMGTTVEEVATSPDSYDDVNNGVGLKPEATVQENTVQLTTVPENTVQATTSVIKVTTPQDDDEMAIITECTPPNDVCETPIGDDSMAQPKAYNTYSVVLPNNIAGFAYNNTVLQGRIKSYFSFADDIECIIPMGTYEDTSERYVVLVVNVSNLNEYSVLREVINCPYCYLTTDAIGHFESSVGGLDFNGNGLPASEDDEDQQTILGMLQ
jgi:hypothetical protein